jgi:competence protein ComEA
MLQLRSRFSQFLERCSHVLLRRTDQAVIAAGLCLAWILLTLWWASDAGTFRRRVEFESLEKQSLQFSVDINSAPWTELAELPGVGETLARRIVESRERQGPFTDLAELRRVHGVGKTTLGQITPFLRPITASKSTP